VTVVLSTPSFKQRGQHHVRCHGQADRGVRLTQRRRVLPRPRGWASRRSACRVENFPPHFEHFPEHDRAHDGQEEVYTALSGSATLLADGEEHRIEPGVFARVGPGVTRKITTGDDRVQLLAIGGTPGAAYVPPPFSEAGAPFSG